jgi:shikimate dehydrogenase
VNSINKDTKIYGSFSSNPGNNGCVFFNNKFKENNINAIYKSFYSENIEETIQATKHLGFSGFALSMPLKTKILEFLDEYDQPVLEIGACNTILIKNNKLHGYNTDWIGVKNYIPDTINKLTILGNGGFSKAVQYVCKIKNISFKVITRENWNDIHNLEGYVFNATPIDIITKGILIDGRPFTESGKEIARLQAEEQYKIYING